MLSSLINVLWSTWILIVNLIGPDEFSLSYGVNPSLISRYTSVFPFWIVVIEPSSPISSILSLSSFVSSNDEYLTCLNVVSLVKLGVILILLAV